MDTETIVNNKIDDIVSSEVRKDVIKDEANTQCSPDKEFDGISCVRLYVLVKLAEAFNKENKNNKIKLSSNLELLKPKKYKAYLVKELNDRVIETSNGKCKNHKCWSRQRFIENLEREAREELLSYTFKPKAPEGKFEWLSTMDINSTMKQYELKHKDFKFMGAVPMDFKEIKLDVGNMDYGKFIKNGKTKIGIILNLDNHDQGGSHWVSMFINLKKGQVYYFDSVGIRPEKRVIDLMEEIKEFLINKRGFSMDDIDINYNKVKHQYKGSECGVYSMNFIIRMLNGKDFYHISKNKIKDDEMNKCRIEYFDASHLK